MGVSIFQALAIAGVIIMFYIGIGGAHSDILTDGFQGALMLLLALVALMFWIGFDVPGGFSGMVGNLSAQDSGLVKPLSATHPVLDSKWDVFAIFLAHIPLGLYHMLGISFGL